MRATFDVTAGGVVTRVRTRPVDLVAFERHTGRTVASLADAPHWEDLCYLAWRAATNEPRPPFDTWLDQVEDVTFVGVDAADPTPPGPGPG